MYTVRKKMWLRNWGEGFRVGSFAVHRTRMIMIQILASNLAGRMLYKSCVQESSLQLLIDDKEGRHHARHSN